MLKRFLIACWPFGLVILLFAFDFTFHAGTVAQRQRDDCHVPKTSYTFMVDRDTTWTDTLRFSYIFIYTDPNSPGYESFGVTDSMNISRILERAKLLPYTRVRTDTTEIRSLAPTPLTLMMRWVAERRRRD